MINKIHEFDLAIIGIDYNSLKPIYSIEKCMNILVYNMGMEDDEAQEYLEYNYLCRKEFIFCEDRDMLP